MRALALSPLSRFTPFVPVLLRLGLGAIFVAHGYGKINNGIGGFNEMLTGLNVPAPTQTAWLIALTELICGVLLLLGLITRLATIPLIATMIGAYFLVKLDIGIVAGPDEGVGAEIEIAIVVGLGALLVLGGGPLSLDRVLGIDAVRENERTLV